MVKAWLKDHTVVIDFPRSCFFFRPSLSLDGVSRFNGNVIPWFRRKALQSKGGGTIWNFFAIPYLCFCVVKYSNTRQSDISRKTV